MKPPPRTMPQSIKIALLALILELGISIAWVLIQLVGSDLDQPLEISQVVLGSVGSICVTLLILWGIVVGNRLAWQWGRLIAPLGAFLLGLSIVVGVRVAQNARDLWEFSPYLVTGLLSIVLLLVIFFALGTVSARRHFRLVCPRCGSSRSRAVDFSFSLASCQRCRYRWSNDEMEYLRFSTPDESRTAPLDRSRHGDCPQWYLEADQRKVGPFTLAQVRQFVNAGRLKPTDYVLFEGEPKWVTAGSVEEIFPVVVPIPVEDIQIRHSSFQEPKDRQGPTH